MAWEEIAEPQCEFVAMGCRGAFTGAYYQVVADGAKVGEPLKVTDTFVAGDMVTMADGRICWPYVAMDWDLSEAVPYGGSTETTSAISFACMTLNNSTAAREGSSASTPSSATAVSSSSASDLASTSALIGTSTLASTSALASTPTTLASTSTPRSTSTSLVDSLSGAKKSSKSCPQRRRRNGHV